MDELLTVADEHGEKVHDDLMIGIADALAAGRARGFVGALSWQSYPMDCVGDVCG